MAGEIPVHCLVHKILTKAKQLETLLMLVRNKVYDWSKNLEEDTKGNLPLLKEAFRKRFGEKENKAIHAENSYKCSTARPESSRLSYKDTETDTTS